MDLVTSLGLRESLGISPLEYMSRQMSWTDNSYQIHLINVTKHEECLPCKYQQHIVCSQGYAGCMHMCPHFSHLGVTVDYDTLFYVHLLPIGLKQYLPCVLGEPSPWPQRDSGKARHWEGGMRASPLSRCRTCRSVPCVTKR